MILFEPKVQLEPLEHKYYNVHTGEEYLSVSKLLETLYQPFREKPAYKRATPEKRKEWELNRDDAANHGTRIHNALERYKQSAIILPEDEDLRPMIISICMNYTGYYQTYDELALYSEEHKLAGTSDMVCITKKGFNSSFDIEDYKTNKSKGITYFSDYGDTLYKPFDYLQDCNYVKYSLQLSMYAWMFEQLTGRKCRRLGIRYIPADNYMNHVYIPVMYMKPEVEHILRERKKKLPVEIYS